MKQLTIAIFFILFSTITLTAQTTLTVESGTATLDGVISNNEWSNSTPLTTSLGVTINAMADGQYIYLVAQWDDSTESVAKNRWTFDGTSWSKSGNEDRISFMFDMGQNGTDGASCATMCHGDGLMRTNIGKVDEWHWKAARSNPMGYIDDKYVDVTNQHGDDGQSTYSDNSDDGSGQPTYMADGDSGVNAEFLLTDAQAVTGYDPFGTVSNAAGLAVSFDPDADWTAGDHVPGYVLRVPEGDRASVESAGRFENGKWTVEFRKPYSGTSNDFEVVQGSSVDFTYEIFDNQGGTHPNDGFDATVYTLDFSNIPTSKTTLVVENGEVVLDGTISSGEYTSAPLTTSLGVTLNAMADEQYLYLVAQWDDSTESVAKNRWTFDGTSWSKSGNEDRISFMFDMGQNGADGANCATMCHGDGLMRTNIGKVDEWHWKAARSNPMGYIDDKYVDVTNQHGDDGQSTYSDNSDDGSGQPTYMADGDSGVNAEFLLTDAQAVTGYDPFGTVSNAAGLAVSFDPDADWTAGDHVPGYVLRVPEGDRASVESAGRYENGKWTIEFRKPFSGTSNDFEVVPGSSVDFTYEIFDNQGGTHPNDGFDAMVYSLDFSLVTNIESNEKENSPSAFTLSQNYPNPFNPSTTIKFSIPRTSEVSLKVYNMLGQEIAELINMQMSSGNYTVNFNAENLSSGIYFYSIQAGDFSASKKMLLIK